MRSNVSQIEGRFVERLAFFREAIGGVDVNAATRTERHSEFFGASLCAVRTVEGRFHKRCLVQRA